MQTASAKARWSNLGTEKSSVGQKCEIQVEEGEEEAGEWQGPDSGKS